MLLTIKTPVGHIETINDNNPRFKIKENQNFFEVTEKGANSGKTYKYNIQKSQILTIKK